MTTPITSAIVLVTKTNPDSLWEGTTLGCQYQEAGATGGHLGIGYYIAYILTCS